MKKLKILFLIFSLGFCSVFFAAKLPLSTSTLGGPQTTASIWAGKSALLSVVGGYDYFLRCSKNKLRYQKVEDEQKAIKVQSRPVRNSKAKTKTC